MHMTSQEQVSLETLTTMGIGDAFRYEIPSIRIISTQFDPHVVLIKILALKASEDSRLHGLFFAVLVDVADNLHRVEEHETGEDLHTFSWHGKGIGAAYDVALMMILMMSR